MDTKILREYLLALGFKVDQASTKKFDLAIDGADKRIGNLAKTVGKLGGAATAMVAAFAVQMEDLYYASKLAQSSAKNLQAAEFAGRNIGLTSDHITASITNMARAIRTQPGLGNWLESLGVKVDPKNMEKTWRDMVALTKKMPFYLGAQVAGQFGMDPDTLLLMQQGLDDYDAAMAKRLEMNRQAGVDVDEAARAAKEYSNQVREMLARLGLLKDMFAIALLPQFKEFTTAINDNLDALTRWLLKFTNVKDAVKSLFTLTDAQRANPAKPKSFWDWLTTPQDLRNVGGGPGVNMGNAAARVGTEKGRGGTGNTLSSLLGIGGYNPLMGNSRQLFAGLEAQYGLPPGLLDKVWAQESSRGRNMGPSKAGALGHFQFMPKTAAQFGLTDPNNLEQSATAASKYLSQLLRKYDGDLDKAVAAYNWGPGNMDRYGLGKAPKETRDYLANVTGAQLNADIDIYVQGTSDAQQTAMRTAAELRTSLSDVSRNLGSPLK